MLDGKTQWMEALNKTNTILLRVNISSPVLKVKLVGFNVMRMIMIM